MSAVSQLTKNQALVFDALTRSKGPLSAYNILDELRGEGLKAPLQIYRALDKLLEAGLVHRLESLNAFVACSHPHCHLTEVAAFAICDNCGMVSEFSDDLIEERLKSWSVSHGFKPAKTTVEIRGLCSGCAAA